MVGDGIYRDRHALRLRGCSQALGEEFRHQQRGMRFGPFGGHGHVGELAGFIGEGQALGTLLGGQTDGFAQPARHRSALIDEVRLGLAGERSGIDHGIIQQTSRQVMT